jgi:hypothetical protein
VAVERQASDKIVTASITNHAVRAHGKHEDHERHEGHEEDCHTVPPLAACLKITGEREIKRMGSLAERHGLAGPRYARLSEALIQKHKHPVGKWCLCFWISASLCRRLPQAGVRPALQRDPPVFVPFVLFVFFVLTVGAFGATAKHALINP